MEKQKYEHQNTAPTPDRMVTLPRMVSEPEILPLFHN